MNKLYISVIIYSCISLGNILNAQIGGKSAYEFLNLPSSASLSGLGGHLISIMDEDVSLAAANPASLNIKMHNRLTFSHNFHFADIQNGYIGYGRTFQKLKINTHIGVQYIHYGDFKYSDVLGNQLDNFSVKETAFIVGASKIISQRLSAGINLKSVFSNPESYSSVGILMDQIGRAHV